MLRNILSIIFILLFYSFTSLYAQSVNDKIGKIKSQYEWINSQSNFSSIHINNADFLDISSDHGAELIGYFKNDTLFRIIEKIGLSYAIMTTEYYVWDTDLFFVYDNEQNYEQIIDSIDGFIGFNLDKVHIAYENRRYFHERIEIDSLESGKRLIGLSTPTNFQEKFKSYQNLLMNFRENESDYSQIQGKWTSTTDTLNVVVFDGLTRLDYYDNKYLDQSKIKIENDTLFCWPRKEEHDEYKYSIMSLSDKHLTLLNIPYGGLLLYMKKSE